MLVSQSSLPQQHVVRSGGSGECTREKSDKAIVRSSIVAVALRKLLGDSGVVGREGGSSFKGIVVEAERGG